MPLLVAGAMLLPVFMNLGIISGRESVLDAGIRDRLCLRRWLPAVKMAAVYAVAENLAPLGLFVYVLILKPDPQLKDRWILCFSWAAILVSAYGWYQHLTIPPGTNYG